MCGLVGLAGNLNDSHKKVFRSLLLLDTVRGWDSTGVLRVPSTISAFKTSVAKELGTPYELFTTSTMFDMKNLVLGNNRVLLGHNRYATMGAVDIEGAHPFTFGPIIGAHNGTLKDWKNLSGFYEHSVDSKAIFQNIYEYGIEHTWSNFTGAAALSWWNEKEKTLNFARNNDRPLFMASLDKRKAIIWASEGWMIEAALKAAPNVTLDEV